jgi:hypothetical protein
VSDIGSSSHGDAREDDAIDSRRREKNRAAPQQRSLTTRLSAVRVSPSVERRRQGTTWRASRFPLPVARDLATAGCGTRRGDPHQLKQPQRPRARPRLPGSSRKRACVGRVHQPALGLPAQRDEARADVGDDDVVSRSGRCEGGTPERRARAGRWRTSGGCWPLRAPTRKRRRATPRSSRCSTVSARASANCAGDDLDSQ